MSSKQVISGDIPPCTHRNCWFKRAARGRQSNVSIHASYTCSEYLIRPIKGKTKFIIPEKEYRPDDYKATPKPFNAGKFKKTIIFVKIFLKSCG